MWPELAGSAAAWLAHACWYLAHPLRRASMAPLLSARPWLTRAGRLCAGLCALLALLAWMRGHGVAVGVCCWIAALGAAASVNTLLGPLAPRWLLGLAASSAGLLLLAGLELLLGA